MSVEKKFIPYEIFFLQINVTQDAMINDNNDN